MRKRKDLINKFRRVLKIFFFNFTQGHFFHCSLEREEVRKTSMQEKHQLVASCMHLKGGSYAPRPGTEPIT